MGRNEWADRFVDCVIRRTEWDALPKTNGIVLILVLPTIINIILMFWNAYSYHSAPSSPWFMGFGGLGLVLVVTAVVVIGFWRYDKTHGIPWVGMKKEAC